MSPLEPESRHLMESVLPLHSPAPGMDPAEARRLALTLARRLQGEPADIAASRDLSVAGAGGDIPVRIYTPHGAEGDWLFWIHGGGFMTGGLDTHDLLCRRLAHGSGTSVISVDYRLAPEHPFPAAADDCAAVLGWLLGGGGGLDASRGVVGGSSAGGNLAASSALRRRDAGGVPLKGQVLVYPCVDATMSLSASAPHGEGYQLTTRMMAAYWQAYCGNVPDRGRPDLSPLHAPDLSGLPPTLLMIAELDPLAPEGAAYGERLRSAGNDVRMEFHDGVMHGFFAQAGALSRARDAQASVCEFLGTVLRPAGGAVDRRR